MLPGRRLVAAWFTDRDLLEEPGALEAQVGASRYTRLRFETAGYDLNSPASAPATASAEPVLRDMVAGERWAAVGDAAAAFDPLSSHGLTTALWTGERVGAALASGDDGALTAYSEAHRRGVEEYRAEHARLYGLERRFDSEFWRRRAPGRTSSRR